MKTFYNFINVFLMMVVMYVVFQLIPTLISSDSTEKFVGGVALILLCISFLWTRFVEIFNKVNEDE